MAANPIVSSKAFQLYHGVNFDFLTWLTGSIVPALVCAIALPLVLRWACGLQSDDKQPMADEEEQHGTAAIGVAKPANDDSIVKHAQAELERMGPMSTKEWVMSIRANTVAKDSQLSLGTMRGVAWMPGIVGDIRLYQTRCNIGGTAWDRRFAAYGHAYLERYFEKHQRGKEYVLRIFG